MSDSKNIKRAIVLLSGGLDSATVLSIALDRGFETYAISFDYEQRHKFELKMAKKLAISMAVKRHFLVKFDLRQIGGSALTSEIAAPHGEGKHDQEEIPVTYVPARNTIFLSFALGWAEVLAASHIFIGVNAVDYSGYPDCRPQYIEAFQQMANLATKRQIKGEPLLVDAPLLNMSKAEIISLGLKLGVDYSLTHSCYNPTTEGVSCGQCDSCFLRLNGFREAGFEDPLPYINQDYCPGQISPSYRKFGAKEREQNR